MKPADVKEECGLAADEKREPRTPWVEPFLLLCLLLIAFGVTARLLNLGYPKTFSFDEHHFVENARNYLHGRADWNDHPPLGKLTIAIAIRAFGDVSFAWRTPSLVAGMATILFGGLLARRSFRSDQAGLVGAALLAADGFFIAYSKTAVLDGQLTALALASAYVALGAPGVLRFVGAGFLAGLAASVKMSGLAALGPLIFAAWILAGRRAPLLVTVAGFAFGLAYFSNWWLGQRLSGHEFSFFAPFEETARLVEHHAAMTKAEHPLNSSWPEWFVMRKPIVLFSSSSGGNFRMLSSIGNPLLWFSVSAVTLGTLGLSLWTGVRNLLDGTISKDDPSGGYLGSHGRGAVILLVGFVSFLLPWMLSRRDPYGYHYLPSYAFGMLVLAGALDWVRTRFRLTALVYLALALVVSSFYLPIWSTMPLHESGVALRLFAKGWR